jgi:hypothetical protein
VDLATILNTLKPVDDFWDGANGAGSTSGIESIQLAVQSWQGYGWREGPTGLVVSPFVDKPEDLPAIEAKIKELVLPQVKVEGLVLPPFQEIGRSTPRDLNNAFRPGNVVIGDCSSAHNGTIGAFLKAEGDGSIWLLSNCHVLSECPRARILGAGFTVLGSDVHSVPLNDTNNIVDAAVLKIEQRVQVAPSFAPLGLGRVGQTNNKAMADLRQGTTVSKFGNTTGLTSGQLVLHCPKVKVADDAGVVREFVHQFAIISNGNNGPFADAGDSGSLVVSGELPTGLLFASNVVGGPEIPANQTLKPPFYLANRWDNVLQEVKGVVGSPVKLMLRKEAAAAH